MRYRSEAPEVGQGCNARSGGSSQARSSREGADGELRSGWLVAHLLAGVVRAAAPAVLNENTLQLRRGLALLPNRLRNLRRPRLTISSESAARVGGDRIGRDAPPYVLGRQGMRRDTGGETRARTALRSCSRRLSVKSASAQPSRERESTVRGTSPYGSPFQAGTQSHACSVERNKGP